MSDHRPNILFIITDQQAGCAMSAAGNPHLHTPHMDAIAACGVRFEHSYCAAPVCGPSRNSIITGLMPHETGAHVNGMHPNPQLPNMGSIFRKAGYKTAWCGGWGMPIPESGADFEFLSEDRWGKMRLGSDADAGIVDDAIQFLNRRHDRPFFIGVPLINPHDICWRVREEMTAPDCEEDLPPLPFNIDIISGEPEFIEWCRNRTYYGEELQYTREWNEYHWRLYLHTYYGLVEQVDNEIGRLMAALKDAGLDDDTMIVFTSDHGEGLASHRWIVKLSLYENPVSVPLMFSWNGNIPAGITDMEHLASGIDILLTMCDFTGINSPPMTGVSLRPVIDDPSLAGRDYLVSELSPDNKDLSKKGRMVRTKRFKYLAFSEGAHAEMLFDMYEDRGETRNLVHQSDHAATLANHRNLLNSWIRQCGDDFIVSTGN